MKIMVQDFPDERLRVLPPVSTDRARMADPCHPSLEGASFFLTHIPYPFAPAAIASPSKAERTTYPPGSSLLEQAAINDPP